MTLDLLLDLQTENMTCTLNALREARTAQLMSDIETEYRETFCVIDSGHDKLAALATGGEAAHTEK